MVSFAVIAGIAQDTHASLQRLFIGLNSSVILAMQEIFMRGSCHPGVVGRYLFLPPNSSLEG